MPLWEIMERFDTISIPLHIFITGNHCVCVAADVPGLPVLPGLARRDSVHQPASLHVLQRLVHVSEHQPGGGSQPLPGPASVWYVQYLHQMSIFCNVLCNV